MAGASILYGQQNGVLVHVDDVPRGLACDCVCPECSRPLMAKQGAVLAHHFQHVAEDVQCSPTVESLVHRYAKEQVARLAVILLPGFEVEASFRANDRTVHTAYQRFRQYRRTVLRAQLEEEYTSPHHNFVVRPDVMIKSSESHFLLAVEVYFRHAVDEEKRVRLALCPLASVELDLSDLAPTAPAHVIRTAVADPRRWRWIHNQDSIYVQAHLAALLKRSNSIFVPRPPEPVPRITRNIGLPTAKLRAAQGMMDQARRLHSELRVLSRAEMLRMVRHLPFEMRVALHCVSLRLAPIELPLNLTQTIDGQRTLGLHPAVWQTGVFARFCLSGLEFDVRQVEWWVRESFQHEALELVEPLTWTANHFSGVAEALYHFLRNLAAQGLLKEIKQGRPWDSRFVPVHEDKEAVVALLKTKERIFPA